MYFLYYQYLRIVSDKKVVIKYSGRAQALFSGGSGLKSRQVLENALPAPDLIPFYLNVKTNRKFLLNLYM